MLGTVVVHYKLLHTHCAAHTAWRTATYSRCENALALKLLHISKHKGHVLTQALCKITRLFAQRVGSKATAAGLQVSGGAMGPHTGQTPEILHITNTLNWML